MVRASNPSPKLTLIERFCHKTQLEPESGCWLWTGASTGTGLKYGAFGRVRAHRWAYEYFVGPIPDGLTIDHLCRTTKCVNPDHLEAVTLTENILRGFGPTAVNARKTHCPKGHEYTTENTVRSLDGKRSCRACRNAYSRAYRIRVKHRRPDSG